MITTDQIASVFDELRLGETGSALELLGSTWRGIGKRPVDAPTQRQTAENLLLCGMLTSKLGAERKVKGAQEAAKDLLNEAFRLFNRVRDPRKHKAQIELALCYWRSGEVNEAIVYIADVHPTDPQLVFETALTKALLETDTGKLENALATHQSVQSLTDDMPSVLRGQFHQERAVVLRKTPTKSNLDRAILEYQAALFYYAQASCIKGEAMVRNNLASIYRDFGDYKQAHISASRALSLFTRLSNQHLIAEAQDQEASIFFAEGNYKEAARLARIASCALEGTDQKSMLARILVTLGRSLARLGQITAAQEELERAGAIFQHTYDPIGQANVSLTMLEELSLDTETAIQCLAQAARLTQDTHLANRYRTSATEVAIQLLSNNSSTYGDVDKLLDRVRAKLTSRVLTNHGGVNTRGAIVHSAQELGITHTGLLWFLDQHEELGHKKRPKTRIIHSKVQKKSA